MRNYSGVAPRFHTSCKKHVCAVNASPNKKHSQNTQRDCQMRKNVHSQQTTCRDAGLSRATWTTARSSITVDYQRRAGGCRARTSAASSAEVRFTPTPRSTPPRLPACLINPLRSIQPWHLNRRRDPSGGRGDLTTRTHLEVAHGPHRPAPLRVTAALRVIKATSTISSPDWLRRKRETIRCRRRASGGRASTWTTPKPTRRAHFGLPTRPRWRSSSHLHRKTRCGPAWSRADGRAMASILAMIRRRR